MFCYSQSSFEGDVFINFKALINIAHDNISLHWIIDLHTCIDCFTFEFLTNTFGPHLKIRSMHLFLLQGTYMEMLHLWNNNVKKLPLNLLQNYKACSLPKILLMHWELFTHNIGCNQNLKNSSTLIWISSRQPLLA